MKCGTVDLGSCLDIWHNMAGADLMSRYRVWGWESRYL